VPTASDKYGSFVIGANFDKSKRSNFDSAVHVGFDESAEVSKRSSKMDINRSSMPFLDEAPDLSALKNLQKLKN
jgi:hypothetical protein